MGTVEDDESQQTRARYNKKTSRTSATVSFQAKPSVISFNDETQDFEESMRSPIDSAAALHINCVSFFR